MDQHSTTQGGDGDDCPLLATNNETNKQPYPWKPMVLLMLSSVGSSWTYAGINAVLALYFHQVIPLIHIHTGLIVAGVEQ